MPPKVSLKRTTAKITFEDAATINEVLLHNTTQQLPQSSSLSRSSERLKNNWLPEFRESIVKKIEAHCVEEEEELLFEDRKLNDTRKGKDLVYMYIKG